MAGARPSSPRRAPSVRQVTTTGRAPGCAPEVAETGEGALNALTQALARLLAPEVRVNAVLPGLIDTGWFTEGGVRQETWEKLKDGYRRTAALERFCTPDDVARAITWLALDATLNTGELMIVDGGFLLGAREVYQEPRRIPHRARRRVKHRHGLQGSRPAPA